MLGKINSWKYRWKCPLNIDFFLFEAIFKHSPCVHNQTLILHHYIFTVCCCIPNSNPQIKLNLSACVSHNCVWFMCTSGFQLLCQFKFSSHIVHFISVRFFKLIFSTKLWLGHFIFPPISIIPKSQTMLIIWHSGAWGETFKYNTV